MPSIGQLIQKGSQTKKIVQNRTSHGNLKEEEEKNEKKKNKDKMKEKIYIYGFDHSPFTTCSTLCHK